MQCMATAMTAGAGVSGTRAYIAAKHFSWVTPRRMRAITATSSPPASCASSTLVSGSATPPTRPPGSTAAHSTAEREARVGAAPADR